MRAIITYNLKQITAIGALLVLCQVATAQSTPIRIYLSNSGSDTNIGTSASAPIKSFNQAQNLVSRSLDRGKDIHILIRPGIYENVFMQWNIANTMPNNKIVFMPWTSNTTFNNSNLVRFVVTNGRKSDFFSISNTTDISRKTNLVFFHLSIENYFGGILFNGKRSHKSGQRYEPGAITHNQVINCRFYKIGGLHFGGSSPAYKAIGLNNSDNNVIRYNHFLYIENTAEQGSGLIHGIYAAHNSSNNTIYYNYFERNSGHPIKFRDNSSFNSVRANTFVYSGSTAMVQDWYLSTRVNTGRTRYTSDGYYECPSWENEVLYNHYNKSYFNSNNPTGLQRQTIPVGIVIHLNDHLDCPQLGVRMRAYASSNPENNSLTELRARPDQWQVLIEQWVENNIR